MLIAHHHSPLQILHQKNRPVLLHPRAETHQKVGLDRPRHQSHLKVPKRAPLHLPAAPLGPKDGAGAMLKGDVRLALPEGAVAHREAALSGAMSDFIVILINRILKLLANGGKLNPSRLQPGTEEDVSSQP